MWSECAEKLLAYCEHSADSIHVGLVILPKLSNRTPHVIHQTSGDFDVLTIAWDETASGIKSMVRDRAHVCNSGRLSTIHRMRRKPRTAKGARQNTWRKVCTAQGPSASGSRKWLLDVKPSTSVEQVETSRPGSGRKYRQGARHGHGDRYRAISPYREFYASVTV
ncbi:hypothetical protein BS50DRAFT_408266 [Corynespora cassiicola Philippines]|uniref:Uncharacterized protein n=1 Tax=Corynespora cassiicola Philippines TaxID=1448308 RepID=A0A2T2NL52_CORCC|nr:hypothetical protein BS50DRAFT_408266 [Corynespora cassiicola Philippines]